MEPGRNRGVILTNQEPSQTSRKGPQSHMHGPLPAGFFVTQHSQNNAARGHNGPRQLPVARGCKRCIRFKEKRDIQSGSGEIGRDCQRPVMCWHKSYCSDSAGQLCRRLTAYTVPNLLEPPHGRVCQSQCSASSPPPHTGSTGLPPETVSCFRGHVGDGPGHRLARGNRRRRPAVCMYCAYLPGRLFITEPLDPETRRRPTRPFSPAETDGLHRKRRIIFQGSHLSEVRY